MSEWREIWQSSLVAQKQFHINNNFSHFSKLLQDYPDDGMLFYVLGESYEVLNKLKEAKLNYSKAKDYLPVKHWKQIAELGIQRVESKLTTKEFEPGNSFYDIQWNTFHKLHKFVYLPDDVRYKAITAISSIDSDYENSVALFRTCLEISLKELLTDTTPFTSSDDKLVQLINEYCLQYIEGKHIKNQMKSLRVQGNNATHHNDFDSSVENLLTILDNFYKVMKVLNKNFKQIIGFIAE